MSEAQDQINASIDATWAWVLSLFASIASSGSSGEKTKSPPLKMPPTLVVKDRPAKALGITTIGSKTSTAATALEIAGKPEPIGWFAALVAFGGQVFGSQIKYCRDRGHISPWYRVKETGNANWAGPEDIEIHAEDADHLWRARREPVCPLFPTVDAGPLFLSQTLDTYAKWNDWGKGLKQEAVKAWIGVDQFQFPAGYPYMSPYSAAQFPPLSVWWEQGGKDAYGDAQQAFTLRWPVRDPGEPAPPDAPTDYDRWVDVANDFGVDSSMYLDERWPAYWSMRSDGLILDYQSNNYPGGTGTIRPALAVAAWLRWRDSATGRSATLMPSLLGAIALEPYKGAMVRVPTWARTNLRKRAEWATRFRRWWYRAGWLVWAMECYRAHAQPTKEAPAWWVQHCEAWGLPLRGRKYAPLLTIRKPSDDFDIEELMHIVQRTCPIPGSPATLGQQIVEVKRGPQNGAMFTRHILDCPDECGSMAPPYRADWVSPYLFAEWGKKQDKSDFNIIQTMISVEAAFCSSGVGSALTNIATQFVSQIGSQAAQQLVLKVVSLSVQACFKLAQGKSPGELFSAGDVVGLIGDACDLAGLDAGNVMSSLSPDVWEAVCTGASLATWKGDFQLGNKLGAIQSRLQELKQGGWDHIDAAFGGLGMTGTAKETWENSL